METQEVVYPDHNQSALIFGLAWMLVAVFIIGFIESDFFKSSITSKNIPALITNALVGIGFLSWLKEDAKKQNYFLSKTTKFFAVVIPQITVFVYCYTSRGFKKGSLQALKAIGFGVLCFMMLLITALLFDN